MSTNSYNSALDFMPVEAAGARGGLFSRIREYLSAMHAGLDAWREYERLTAAGVASDQAARRSFQRHFAK